MSAVALAANFAEHMGVFIMSQRREENAGVVKQSVNQYSLIDLYLERVRKAKQKLQTNPNAFIHYYSAFWDKVMLAAATQLLAREYNVVFSRQIKTVRELLWEVNIDTEREKLVEIKKAFQTLYDLLRYLNKEANDPKVGFKGRQLIHFLFNIKLMSKHMADFEDIIENIDIMMDSDMQNTFKSVTESLSS